MIKVAFICVHNSCRSQMAEALGKHLAADTFESYSAGTETQPRINGDAVRIMKEQDVSGLIVVDADGKLAGMLTHRDVDLADDFSGNVSDLMTPGERVVFGKPGVTASCPH